jgi:hypothetical protein
VSLTGEKHKLNLDDWPVLSELYEGSNEVMAGHLNEEEFNSWWRGYLEYLPEDKASVFRDKAVSLLEQYLVAKKAWERANS